MGAAVAGALGAAGMAGTFLISREARKRVEAAMAKAREDLEKVGIPSIEAQRIVLENPDFVFQYDPELVPVLQQQASEFQKIEDDKAAQSAEYRALEGITERTEEGITPEDRAQLNEVRRQIAQQTRAEEEAILQNQAARGILDSGSELALRAIANQQTAQQGSAETDRLAAMAQQSRMAALAQLGQLGGAIGSRRFGQQAQAASAQDAINAFNVQNAQSVTSGNVANMNQAQLQAAQIKQALEENRAQTANQQEMYNKGLLQQKFENEMRKQGALSQTQMQLAGIQGQLGGATAQGFGQIAAGAMQAGGGMFSDERFKITIENIDTPLDKIEQLNGVQYDWLKEQYPEYNFPNGKDVGIIAQDVEKIIPSAVSEDINGYKMVQYHKIIPLLIEGIKELKKDNEDLRAKLENLNG